MQSIIFTILCVSTLIHLSFQTHPRYSYVCKEDGSVEFTGFKKGSTVTISGSSNSSCADETSAEAITSRTDQVVTIEESCMGKDLTEDRNITVKVIDKNLGEDKASHDSRTDIIGGLESHTFLLKCTHISTVNRTVLRQFHLIDTENILSKQNEIGQVDMRFKGDDNIHLPDISEVYIGDEFYMFLQYTGASDYLIEPQSCTAFEGNDIFESTATNITLWTIDGKQSDKCITPEAKQLNLLGKDGFQYVNDKTVRTRLNGFRFKSNPEDITIFCRVLLKLPPAISATDSICSGTNRRRRKRSSDTASLAVVHTLSVKDRANRGSSFASCTVVQVFTVAASLFILRIL